MKKHQITIIDIARELKISKSTVSRALCDHPDISKEMKAAILEVAARLDYQPNLLAQSLIRNETHIIGVVIPDIERPFFASIISGIHEVAYNAGYRVMVCQSNETHQTEVSNVQALIMSRVDGLLICHSKETTQYSHVKVIGRKGIPLVFFDRICDEIDADKVFIDNEEAGFIITEHLIKAGCKRIALLAGPKFLPMSESRLSGYKRALKKYRITVNEEYIYHGDFRSQTAIDFASRMVQLKKRPDGIFSIYDGGAIDVMMVLKERKINIPKEIAVAGMGNEPLAAVVEPGLTTLHLHPLEMGMTAADMFLQQVLNTTDTPPQSRVIKTELIVRGSTTRN